MVLLTSYHMAIMELDIQRGGSKEAFVEEYATEYSAGFEIRAAQDTVIPAGSKVLVPTGLYVARAFYVELIGDELIGDRILVPELQIRDKSGKAYKTSLKVHNSPGTVDADFPQEIKVMLLNMGEADVTVNAGDAIAQGVYGAVVRRRGGGKRVGGFGSTGS